MVAAPVGVIARVGHSCNADKLFGAYKVEKLFPHRCQVYKVAALSEIFLRNLQLCHHRCMLNLVEQRSIRLARLEVERTVLCLQNNIAAELSVEVFKLCNGLHYAVFALMIAVNEAAPYDQSAVRGKSFCKHVGSLGMCAVIVAGAGLSF